MPVPNSHRRLLAIDPSLACSGWALFGIVNERALAVGKIKSLRPSFPLADRLCDIQAKVARLLEQFTLGEEDILICEAPTTVMDPSAFFKVEQVRGIFETLARARRMSVPGRIHPRSVQYEIMGLKGAQQARKDVKEIAAHLTETLFAKDLKAMNFPTTVKDLMRHQDICDALLLGKLALSKINSAVRCGESLSQPFETMHRGGRYATKRS